MSIRDRTVIASLSIAAIALVAILWWISRDGGPPVEQLAQRARELQRAEKWCEAQDAWQKTLDRLGDTNDAALQQEATVGWQNANEKCQTRVDTLKPAPPHVKPAPVPEDQIARFYKVGRTIHSVTLFNVTGSGTSRHFILQGSTNFAYQYQVVAETKVVENRQTAVVFALHFLNVAQLRAESHQELELSLPESPILAIVWNELEKEFLNPIPLYAVVKHTAELINIADPGLKNTLTRFHDTLRHLGKPLVDDVEVPLVERVSELAGQRILMTYVSGLGVTEIKVLAGKTLPPRDLERLAYGSSLLLDYFLGKAADAEPGTTITVPMADLGGLFGLFEFEASGELKFKKNPNADLHGEPLEVLEAVGGEVTLESRFAGASGRGRIKPLTGGYVYYSPNELLVRRAQFAWQGDAEWFGRNGALDSLLQGVANVSRAKVETYYEAELVEPGSKGATP